MLAAPAGGKWNGMPGTRRPVPGEVSSSGKVARRSAGSAGTPSSGGEAEPAAILTAGMLTWFCTWWFLLPVWSRLRHSAGLSPRR